MRRYLFTLLAALLLWGCASTGTGTAEKPRGSRYLIMEEEIVGSGATNAYDVIQQLKPDWFLQSQRRGVKSITIEDSGEPVVYVNDSRYGNVESLRSISSLNIVEIRFLQPSDATTRFGTGHVGGAFMVKVK